MKTKEKEVRGEGIWGIKKNKEEIANLRGKDGKLEQKKLNEKEKLENKEKWKKTKMTKKKRINEDMRLWLEKIKFQSPKIDLLGKREMVKRTLISA